MQRSTTRISLTMINATKRKGGHLTNANRVENATNILFKANEGSWWLGGCKLCSGIMAIHLGY